MVRLAHPLSRRAGEARFDIAAQEARAPRSANLTPITMDERQARAAQDDLDRRVAVWRQHAAEVPARALAAVRLGEIRASVALAGIAMSDDDVRTVLERRASLHSRPLRDSLVVAGYAAASRWISSEATRRDLARPAALLAAVRKVHALAIGPETALEPLGGAPVGTPGGWRPGPACAYADGVVPLPPWSIPTAMEALAAKVAARPPAVPPCLWLARAHASVLRIRPFASGNGRTARLLVNLLLARLGLPPWTIDERRRDEYRAALRRAGGGAQWALAYEIALGVGANVDRLLAAIPGADALAPLAALADPVDVPRLRKAAQRGRLRHVRRGPAILTTRTWLAEYDAGRAPQGRRPDEALHGGRTRTRA
jgi:Fic family protein